MGIGIGIGIGISPGASAGGSTPTAAPELTYVFEWDGFSQATASPSGKTYDVDWGDGRGLLTGQVSRTRSAYSGAAQDYTVKISGLTPSANFPYLQPFMSQAGYAQTSKVKEIISFGTSIEWQRIYNDLGNMTLILLNLLHLPKMVGRLTLFLIIAVVCQICNLLILLDGIVAELLKGFITHLLIALIYHLWNGMSAKTGLV